MSDALFVDDQPTDRVLKRAQYEDFAFSLVDGGVLVRNESHADPSDHEYRVELVDGIPTACECPADEHYDGPCKHRTAVAIRSRIRDVAERVEAVLDAADISRNTLSAELRRRTTRGDSDHELAGDTEGVPHRDARPTDCDCAEFGSNEDLACWPCYREGFEKPAAHNDSG